jgi:hypothetical protein
MMAFFQRSHAVECRHRFFSKTTHIADDRQLGISHVGWAERSDAQQWRGRERTSNLRGPIGLLVAMHRAYRKHAVGHRCAQPNLRFSSGVSAAVTLRM